VVAIIALVISCAGTATAATVMITSSKQIAPGAVALSDLSKSTRKALAGKAGPAGPQGPQGPQGPKGDAGAPNPNAVSAQNADKLDGLDSTDLLRARSYVVSQSGSTSGAGTFYYFINCDTGDIAVGGGYSGLDSTSVPVTNDRNGGLLQTTWRVGIYSAAADSALTTYVVCLDQGAPHS
jgi:hypothetical protein